MFARSQRAEDFSVVWYLQGTFLATMHRLFYATREKLRYVTCTGESVVQYMYERRPTMCCGHSSMNWTLPNRTLSTASHLHVDCKLSGRL